MARMVTDHYALAARCVLLGALILLFCWWRPMPILVWQGATPDPVYHGLLLFWAARTVTVGHLLFAAAAAACAFAGYAAKGSLLDLARAEFRRYRQRMALRCR